MESSSYPSPQMEKVTQVETLCSRGLGIFSLSLGLENGKQWSLKTTIQVFFVTLRSGFGKIRASKALQWCSLIPCSQSTTSINLSEYRYRYLISIFVLLSISLCLAELKQKLLKLLNMSSSSISRFYYVEIIFISIGQIMFQLFYQRELFYCE